MDLLVADGDLEWQGSLRKTYDKYLHPSVIEMEDEDMFKALREGKVLDAFQYDSVQGVATIAKIQPSNFRELSDGNALMRLNPKEVELPILTYVRHKEDITIWYADMVNAGLTMDEMEILKKHLSKSYGVAPTQESIMKLSMDVKISGFNMVQANKLRKAVAKSYAKDTQKQVRELMINQGVKLGNRKKFIEYVWERYCVPQLGYSFSEPHLAGYSLILMQELNLATKYPNLYWNTACLSVNAGNLSEEVTKGTNYGAIAKAIAGMEKGFVLPPYINRAGMEFLPIKELDKSMYSMNAINGIGEEVAKGIIANRPYATVGDFITKCVDTKIVSNAKMYALIKAGCFDELESDRVKLMVDYVGYSTEKKVKLTTANLPKIIEFGLLPVEHKALGLLYQFRKLAFAKGNLVESINKTSGLYEIPSNLVQYYLDNYDAVFGEAYEVSSNGKDCLNNKVFDKIYKKQIEPLTEWLLTEQAIENYNRHQCKLNWDKYCDGTKESWEMQSICYYTDKHELSDLDLESTFSIKGFMELPYEPTVINTKMWRGRPIHEYQLDTIAGTVVDKNKNKGIVTIVTKQGDVVDIKLDKGRFSYYDRTTDLEKSWLTRGNKLVIVGYRRGEVFYPKVYKKSIYQHSILKIEGYDFNRNLPIVSEQRLSAE